MKIIEPHGGCGLINRIIPIEETDEIKSRVESMKQYVIDDGDLSVFFRIADGTLSPLEGPMNEEEFNQVLDEEIIIRKGKKFAWTIPVSFPIFVNNNNKYKIGETIAIRNKSDMLVGTLEISDIFKIDKKKYNECVYMTKRTDHPGPQLFNSLNFNCMLGGKIKAFPQPKNYSFNQYILTPHEIRNILQAKKWERIVAFQTRNPLHRAHEYAIVYALEDLCKKGIDCGAVLNPLVGQTKSDDVPANIRMQTYEVLINGKLLGKGDLDDIFWSNQPFSFYDRVLLIALDMKMFYAGPKEAIMHAIYRQNCGFTDIIINRKHADAPYFDGTPVWGDFDAQKKIATVHGELLIKPYCTGYVAYFDEIKRVGLAEFYKQKGYHEVSISGKEIRKQLEENLAIDERIMRKEVAEILKSEYRKGKNIHWTYSRISNEEREWRNKHKGVVLWFTGLPSSGKSTIAFHLEKKLFILGHSPYVLDGDNIRYGLNKDLTFDSKGRQENIRRIGEVAKLFCDAGFITITAFISPFRMDRRNVRAILKAGEFVEVYIKTHIDICKKRDPKGLYHKALAGKIPEFTGVNSPYEEPMNPEMVINTERYSIEECVGMIYQYLKEHKFIF